MSRRSLSTTASGTESSWINGLWCWPRSAAASRGGRIGWARTISSTWACSARSATRRSPATWPSRWRRTACPTPSCRGAICCSSPSPPPSPGGATSPLVGGMCETDFSGYPDCRDDTIKALQVALNLGMDRSFVLHTPLMWLDKAGDLGAGPRAGRRGAGRDDPRAHPHLLPERARAARRLGPWLRRVPRLRLAQAGLLAWREGRKVV